MSVKIETKKIKVNNGQELITEAKKWKNSGGEWKLREFYLEMPKGKNTKKQLNWGIIISNGEKKVNLCAVGEKCVSKSGIYDEVAVRDQLHQLFPRAAEGLHAGDDPEHDEYGGRPLQAKLDNATRKLVKEAEGECWLYRYLVAESSWQLKQILHEYIRDNENKIYQSPNPHFSGWVEIVNGQDGNIYLYVGEKNENGGREIKIGITKSEFEDCKGSKFDNPYTALEAHWVLFTVDRPLTPAETRGYYFSGNGLEKYWQNLQKFWEKTCRTTLEDVRGKMNDKLEFLNKEPKSEVYDREKQATRQKLEKIERRLADIKKNHPERYLNYNKECPKCGNKMCCHYESRCAKGKKCEHLWFLGNQMSNSDKQKLLQLFLKYNIKKITLDESNQIVIEYNNGKKETEELSSSKLQQYEDIIQTFPNSSLSLTDLQINADYNNHTTQDKSLPIIGLIWGGSTLIAMIAYLFVKRKFK